MKKIILSFTLLLSFNAFSAEVLEITCPSLLKLKGGSVSVVIGEDLALNHANRPVRNNAMVKIKSDFGNSYVTADVTFSPDRNPNSSSFIISDEGDAFLRVDRVKEGKKLKYSAYVLADYSLLYLEKNSKSACSLSSKK